MIQLHLHHEAANVGAENGMDGVLLTGKNLPDSSYLAAGDHVQVAVVDWSPHRDAALVIVRDEGEVNLLTAGDDKVVGRLLGSRDRFAETVDLLAFFMDLLLRYVDGDI